MFLDELNFVFQFYDIESATDNVSYWGTAFFYEHINLKLPYKVQEKCSMTTFH